MKFWSLVSIYCPTMWKGIPCHTLSDFMVLKKWTHNVTNLKFDKKIDKKIVSIIQSKKNWKFMNSIVNLKILFKFLISIYLAYITLFLRKLQSMDSYNIMYDGVYKDDVIENKKKTRWKLHIDVISNDRPGITISCHFKRFKMKRSSTF